MSEVFGANIEAMISKKIEEQMRKKTEEICSAMNAYRANEFSRELPLIGRADLYNKLNAVKATVEKKDDNTYTIIMDMQAMDEGEKELYRFYQANAKLLSL